MNELKVISEQEVLGSQFRIYGDFDNPLFLAKDVAVRIEHSDVSTMLKMVSEEEKLTQTMFVSGQNRKVWMITEDGLHEILMKSDKPIAKEFKKVVKEILKTIRKTGGYVVENRAIDFVSNWLPNLDETSKSAIAGMLEENQKLRLENSKQKEVIEIQKPKADYFDCLVETNLLTGFRDCSKELGVKQNEFMKFLEEKKFIYRDKKDKPRPYAHHVDSGLFELKDFTSGSYSDVRTFITVKGKETFRLLLQVR